MAWRWRRAIEKELRELELTFTQWLVLDATADAIREQDDAVNQNAVAARVELDRVTTSQVMRTLSERGLVDRGGDATGRAYRIILTRRGERLLRRANEVVERATLELRR